MMMTSEDLFEVIPSDTLERDLDCMRNGGIPAGYSIDELELMRDYLDYNE